MDAWSHSGNTFPDNCYRDYAQQNARELADLIDVTRLTVGEGELEEYEHVPIDRRFNEMSIFYYWWSCHLVFNSTTYEFKTDYAQTLAEWLVLSLPGTQPILTSRWLEYEDASQHISSLTQRALLVARRVLQHMDPKTPVSAELSQMLGEEATEVVTNWFRERTTWGGQG